MLSDRTNIFQLEPYWRRTVNQITDLRQQLRMYEAMNDRAAANVCRQQIEQLEKNRDPGRQLTEETRWDWMIKDNKPQTKMDTQGL